MSSHGGDWSWGPETRAKPAAGSILTVALAAAIAALLAAGGAGLAVHHRSTTSSAAVIPIGYQRVLDSTNGMSLAVPAGWRTFTLSTGQLSSDLQALKGSEPQLSALLDLALAGLQRIQPGAFAIDAATRTTLFAYGVAAPGIRKVGDIPAADVVAPFSNVGAKNVKSTRIHLTVGDAERVSAQLPIGGVTVTELLDYFVLHGRVVAIVLASRGTEPLTGLFHQIEATLAAA